MATGRVKWFSEQKGYGFIQHDDGREVFVHHTGIVGDGFKNLHQGQEVEFEIADSDKGPKAENVTILS